jgi:hypothetical protein
MYAKDDVESVSVSICVNGTYKEWSSYQVNLTNENNAMLYNVYGRQEEYVFLSLIPFKLI